MKSVINAVPHFD